MTFDIVTLVGNPRAGSRTRALADAVAGALVPGLAARGVRLTGATTLELADLVAVSFGPETARPPVSVEDPHATVRAARLLIVATPTYKGTYTGLLKIFLDQYGPSALAGTVAVAVAIAASEPHRAAVGLALSQLLGELGATAPAPPLTILEPDAADSARAAAYWSARHGAAIAAALGDAVR